MTRTKDEMSLRTPPIRKITSLPVSRLAVQLGLEFVKRDPLQRFLENPSLVTLGAIPKREQTGEMARLAIDGERQAFERGEIHYGELKNASKRALDRDMCLEACGIDGFNIRFVPKGYLDYEMYLAAVREHPGCIGLVPDRFVDEAMLDAAVTNGRHPGSFALEKVLEHADKVQNVAETCRKAVLADPMAIDQVPTRYQTRTLCREAVTLNPAALRRVPDRCKTEELCRIAVTGDPMLLGDVPQERITRDMAYRAVERNPLALQYVPEDMVTEDLAEMAVKSTRAVPGETRDWPIRYVPPKHLGPHPLRGLNRLVSISLEIDPRSIAAVPDRFLNASAVKKVVSEHPDIYGELSEPTRSRKSIAELAVRLDWRNERHLPDCLRGRVFHDGKAAPICQKPRTSETTKSLEDEDRRLWPLGEVGLDPVHDSLGPDRRRRYIHYISDIHIDHQLRLTGTPYAETVGRIRRRTDGLVASRRDEDLFLLAGDIAPSARGMEAFLDAYRLSLGEEGRMGTMLCVLGNHELWSGQVPGPKCAFDLDVAVNEYRDACRRHGAVLLENDLYIEYRDSRFGRIIDEGTLLSAEDGDLGLLLGNCRLIVLGGCGYSGIGDGIKVDLLNGGAADAERSARFRRLHDKLLRCAGGQRVVVLTHYPLGEWSTGPGNPEWVYVSGHTHRNTFSEGAGRPTVLADGQVGYRPSKWGYRTYALDTTGCCDPLAGEADGIYEVDARLYEDFNRARGIDMSKFNRAGRVFALKRGDTYMFVHRGEEGGNLHLLAGGRITNLSQADIGYYYRNLQKYSERVERLFAPYYSVLMAISEEVKGIGGYGFIHGSIVDIDFFNHIYLDPLEGSLTPYYAESTEERVVYDTVELLLKGSPLIDGSIKRGFLRARKRGDLAMIAGAKSEYRPNPALAPVLSTDKAMYAKSNAMKSVQYLLERNVVRIWNDRVLEGSPSIRLDGDASDSAKGLLG